MTEKMKYINIMGNMKDIDYVIDKYICKYDLQLEYTLKELPNEKELVPIQSEANFARIYKDAETVFKSTGLDDSYKRDMTGEEAEEIINHAMEYMANISRDMISLKEKSDEYTKVCNIIEPFIQLDFRLEDIKDFEFISYQFGKMPVSSFKQFETFLYKDNAVIFMPAKTDGEFLWGAYFSATFQKDKVDSVFSSLHFEKIDMPFEILGEPLVGDLNEIYDSLKSKIETLKVTIVQLQEHLMHEADKDKTNMIDKQRIVAAYNKIKELTLYSDVKKYGAVTNNDFFIFLGWIQEDDSILLENDVQNDVKVIYIVEEDHKAIISIPPTKLKNNFLCKPFEMFVKMYGLPSYNEIDPTPFVALTYTFLFGIMFGDVGQGLVLLLLGLYLFKKKGIQLGSILMVIGLSSSFFGTLFGSFFGYEFHGLWKSPADPDNVNTILIYAVVIGVVLIFVSMVFNILNSIKRREFKKMLLDPSGIAGFIFYLSLIITLYLTVIGHVKIGAWFIVGFLAIPMILIAFREPIINVLNKKKEIIHSKIGLFLFETVIELFEVLLSYFTNTVSFVRVGAFALSHASMMGVVWMLAKTTTDSYNIIVIILGNILVLALEGLIVGIQVLRIEFYEMFSRFYKGTGREFVPLNKTINK